MYVGMYVHEAESHNTHTQSNTRIHTHTHKPGRPAQFDQGRGSDLARSRTQLNDGICPTGAKDRCQGSEALFRRPSVHVYMHI